MIGRPLPQGETFAEGKGEGAGGQMTDVLGRQGLNRIGFRDYQAGGHGAAALRAWMWAVRRNVFQLG